MSRSRKDYRVRILMVGGRNYLNNQIISSTLWGLINEYGNHSFKVATFGNPYGAERKIKQLCIKLDIDYIEFNPYHEQHTVLSYMPKHMFNKKYSPKNFFMRESHAVDWADMIIIFDDKLDKNIKRFSESISKKNTNKILILE